jgi:hypothetical protein
MTYAFQRMKLPRVTFSEIGWPRLYVAEELDMAKLGSDYHEENSGTVYLSESCLCVNILSNVQQLGYDTTNLSITTYHMHENIATSFNTNQTLQAKKKGPG